jgi:hypothetical protein
LAVREAARLLELHGRLSGELDASGCIAIQVNAVGSAGAGALPQRISDKLATLALPAPIAADVRHELSPQLEHVIIRPGVGVLDLAADLVPDAFSQMNRG